ncbi:integrase [Vreelandella rituensis]|uniref:Integrase n=2 Tax=Vreelandella rituensis TaxID=2282306 RepID=A0A368U4H2_9GAMM|nr:integrase [Halomonas rituensis]
MTQLPGAVWESDTWTVTGGRLLKQSGKNSIKASINFEYSPKLGLGDADPLEDGFAELGKTLVVLRFHRKAQSVTNLRQFIYAISFVAYVLRQGGRNVGDITPGDLEDAAGLISKSYAESTAYQMQKALGEFAAHLDANELCKVRLDWKYSKMKRPDSASGVGMIRLDDPVLDQETSHSKMVSEKVYLLIATLFQKVPAEHPSRLYVLMLTLFACLGRRFSEVAYLPDQVIEEDRDGNAFITYFKRKTSQGDTYTPSEKLPIPTEAAQIVMDTIAEVHVLCEPARQIAAEMRRHNGPDLRFLDGESVDRHFYKKDLKRLGLSPTLLDVSVSGWLHKNGWARQGEEYRSGAYRYFTSLEGIKAYCRRDFHPSMVEPIHIDQFGKKFYPEHMLFLQNIYLGGNFRSLVHAHWLAGIISHPMLSGWITRQLPALSQEYAQEVVVELDFTSHMFRHTVNTLLDEGGLPELIQTQWFGRDNPRDTKAYQHTSREKRVKEVQEALLAGEAEGALADQMHYVPIDKRKAFVKISVRAVHDVGTGICVHDFTQTPCERHLQCQADCHDYVYAKTDPGRADEIRRLWANTMIQLDLAKKQEQSARPRKSIDWIAHHTSKLKTLARQMELNGIEFFDPYEYAEELAEEVEHEG